MPLGRANNWNTLSSATTSSKDVVEFIFSPYRRGERSSADMSEYWLPLLMVRGIFGCGVVNGLDDSLGASLRRSDLCQN